MIDAFCSQQNEKKRAIKETGLQNSWNTVKRNMWSYTNVMGIMKEDA